MPRSLKSALLVRFNGCLHDSDLLQHLAILAAQGAVNEGELVFQCVEINQAVDDSRTYIYFWSRNPGIPAISLLNPVSAQWLAAAPGLEGLEVQRLQPVIERVGASAGGQADFHYVVETDVDEANANELADWYATEHLPLLAAVPGNILARRLQNLDGSPRSFACYDLTRPEVLATPAWLAVRETQWSSQVRPMFKNTRRTMFKRVLTIIV